MNSIAAYIDHTLLRADATLPDIKKLCAEAREYSFWSVCVHGSWVPDASRFLNESRVKIAAVVGFPLGAMTTGAKCIEAETAITDGAQEIDAVLNIGRLKQGDDAYILHELRAIVRASGGRTVKVILETCLLRDDEKIRACQLAMESGAHFVKTSTGFSSGGATTADVALMRKTVGPEFGVKASGGIRDAKTALGMIDAGATRIGTSAGVAILTEWLGTMNSEA